LETNLTISLRNVNTHSISKQYFQQILSEGMQTDRTEMAVAKVLTQSDVVFGCKK